MHTCMFTRARGPFAHTCTPIAAATSELEADPENEEKKETLQWATSALADFESSASTSSTLTATLVSVDGLPEAAVPAITLSCTSPIQDYALAADSPAIIVAPDTESAMLSLTVMDADIPVGVSASFSLEPLAAITSEKMLASETEVVKTETIAIVPEDTADGEVLTPVCTVVVEFKYVAGAEERAAVISSELTSAMQAKKTIINEMRQLAATQTAPRPLAGGDGPAVEKGFLNEGRKAKVGMQARMYNFFAGPNSIFMTFVPKYKNFFIFGVGVAFMHFQGHQINHPSPI